MAETLTTRVKAIKNDDDEFVNITEIDAAFDKFDNHFIPACLVRAAAQSIPNNTPTDIDFSAATHDTYSARGEGAMADLANNRIIIRRNGIYILTFQVGAVANAVGGRRGWIDVNGVQICSDEHPGAATGVVCTGSIAWNCTVGDFIKMRFSQNSGGAINSDPNIATNGLHLSATWVGAGVEV